MIKGASLQFTGTISRHKPQNRSEIDADGATNIGKGNTNGLNYEDESGRSTPPFLRSPNAPPAAKTIHCAVRSIPPDMGDR